MRSTARNLIGLVASAALYPSASVALDQNTNVVYARSRPTSTDPDPCVGLNDCFTYTVATRVWSPQNLWNGAAAWIWATRVPSAAKPLLVDIGPGTFGRIE